MPITRRRLLRTGIAASLATSVSALRAQQRELIRKPIPSSSEQIPVVGIGTNRYRATKGSTDYPMLRNTVERFVELGGSVVDTAPAYGPSENVLGDIFADLGVRDSLFIATKGNHSNEDDIRDQLESSQLALRADVIDCMQSHSMRGWREQLPLMREWKAAGHIRYLGLTTSRESQHDRLAEILAREDDIDVVQLNYSILDRAAEQRLLPIAAERGIAVLVNLPYGRGRTFSAVGDRPLPDFAREFDCNSWGNFFLKYVVSHPAVTCAIPGTTKVHHVEDNLAAARGRLPDADLRQRQEAFMTAL